jgi:P-type Cu+ transporter
MRLDLVEHAAAAQTVLFDKTGTLTEGRLSLGWHVISLECNKERYSRRDWWATVAAVERHASSHPLREAISAAAEVQGGQGDEDTGHPLVTNAKYSPGKGVQGWVALRNQKPVHVAIGSKAFLKSLGIDVDLSPIPQKWRSGVNTTVCVAIAKSQAGIIVLQDRLRPCARDLVRDLISDGLKVGMITGDSWTAATHVARSLDIPQGRVHAELLPLDKAEIVRMSKKQGSVLAVGDNFNDMAAFSEASLGVYTGRGHNDGHGAEAALLQDSGPNGTDLKRLYKLLVLARRVTSRVRQNTYISLGYNLIALLIASGALQQIDSRLELTP